MSPTLSLSDLTAMDYVIVGGKAIRRTAAMADEKETKARLPGRFKSQWEANYAQQLSTLSSTGAIQFWGYECMKLRLANATFWTPDFAVLVRGRLELHEVKGFWRPQARVKVKVAAETFPWLPIHIIRYEKGQFYTVESFNV